MNERLVTVASYDVAYKADLVKTALEEAGIEAFVVDREIVSMEWLLANAVNGVKVQVAEKDAGRAMAFVEELYRDGFDKMKVSDEELERQALEAAPDDDHDVPLPEEETGQTSEAARPTEPGAKEIDRDQYARRFMLCSVFSLAFPPLVIYAFYLGLVTVFGTGPISSVGWQRVGFGVAFGGLWMAVAVWLITLAF